MRNGLSLSAPDSDRAWGTAEPQQVGHWCQRGPYRLTARLGREAEEVFLGGLAGNRPVLPHVLRATRDTPDFTESGLCPYRGARSGSVGDSGVSKGLMSTTNITAARERPSCSRAKAAKSRGVKFGRKPRLTRQQIEYAGKLRNQGDSPNAIADLLRVSRATVYRTLAG
jgi:hypothetical protein